MLHGCVCVGVASNRGKACKVVINNVRPLCKFIADGFQRAVDYV